MSDTLLESIQTLQHRAERLEEEAAKLRRELARVADFLTSPSSVVARYVIGAEIYEITQADVEAVPAELAKPWNDAALYELAAVKKVASMLEGQTAEDQNNHFFRTVEAIRAAAVQSGAAIDSEQETVIGD
jgi:hypothetical protein